MEQPALSHYTRRAMATEFAVLLPGSRQEKAELALRALEAIDCIESLFTVYRPDSDIARLNAAAGQGPVPIAADTLAVLSLAKQLWERTSGAFDVTAGPLVEAWGFTRRQGQKPTQSAIEEARHLVGSEYLRLDPVASTAELRRPKMTVNLGAIGKGYALDKVAGLLRASGLTDFLVHGGRSSVMAWGDDVPGSGSGWKVAIEHPLLPGRRLGGLRLRNQAMGTSGSGKQFFHHRGQRLGHVIDPRTGWPVSELLSLTALCDSATEADALATGAFVLGWEGVTQMATSGFVAVFPTEAQADVKLQRHHVPDSQWVDANGFGF